MVPPPPSSHSFPPSPSPSSSSPGHGGAGDGASGAPASYPGDLPKLLLRPVGGDHEMRHVFRTDLEERLAHAEVPAGGRRVVTAEGAAEWLRALPVDAEGMPRKRRVTPWLLLTALALAVAGLGVVAYEMIPLFVEARLAPPWLKQEAAGQIYRTTSPAEMPPSGFLDGPNDLERHGAERLWKANPANKVIFANYARSKFGSGTIPDAYEETWQRLDPDNGYWLLLEAEKAYSREGDKPRGQELMMQAAGKARLDSYEEEMTRFVKDGLRVPETMGQLAMVQNDIQRIRFRFNPFEWNGMAKAAKAAGGDAGKKVADWVAGKAAARTSYRGSPFNEVEIFHAMLTGVWRGTLLGLAWIFLLISVALGLRLAIGRGSAAGHMGRCLAQMWRPWAGVPAVSLVTLLGMGVYAPWCLTMADEERGESAISLAAPLFAAVAVLALAAIAARREVRRRVAFVGLAQGGKVQTVAAWSVVAFALLAMVLTAGLLLYGQMAVNGGLPWGMTRLSDPTQTIIILVAAGFSVATFVWLGLSGLLGYASPQANVRHRLVAMQLLPLVLTAAISCTVLGLVTQPVERVMVRKAGEMMLKE